METILIVLTAASLLAAVAMGAVAWRVLRDERRRADARVEALAREIHDTSSVLDERFPAPSVVDDFVLRTAPASPSPAGMFASPSSGSRFPLVAGAVALVVGLAMGATWLANAGPDNAGSGGAASAPALNSAGVSTTERQTATAPLELVALGHERDADGLTVRGVLRNPSKGAEIDHLSAVVLLFNRNGTYVATGRAEVHSAKLGPGSETTFVVTVGGAPDADRYRVSFRTDDAVVPHVDHRS